MTRLHEPPPLATAGLDERAARATLRGQIARLERELAASFASAFPRQGFEWTAATAAHGPRLLSLGELERTRDALAERVALVREQLAERAEVERANRLLIARMLENPRAYKFVRVTNADIGEPSCHYWHVRPRLGPLGMLMGWWRVKISSGCPLPWGLRRAAAPSPA